MIPERATPALTSSAEPTMMTMSSLKPVKASSSGTIPTARASSSAQAAHEVVAEAPPDERHHHQRDDGDREDLRRGHGRDFNAATRLRFAGPEISRDQSSSAAICDRTCPLPRSLR